MKAIRLKHGVVFVKIDNFTFKVLPDGTCDFSPVTFEVLEWDLKTEPPSTWEYLTQGEICSLPNDAYQKMLEYLQKVNKALKD
ncbi:MAG: hypothetical protein IKV38_03280 [Clostridia bacterium]|nr:hypothetical protein [Clostridia bacterium]